MIFITSLHHKIILRNNSPSFEPSFDLKVKIKKCAKFPLLWQQVDVYAHGPTKHFRLMDIYYS